MLFGIPLRNLAAALAVGLVYGTAVLFGLGGVCALLSELIP